MTKTLALALLFGSASALNNGVGRAPAMGWNSWNTFRCDINEAIVLEVARAMASNGLRDAGYVYVNIDDCWMKSRDGRGHVVPEATKFPRGMKAVADEVRPAHTPCTGIPEGVFTLVSLVLVSQGSGRREQTAVVQ